VDPGAAHRVEQRQRFAQVLVPVEPGLLHRLADQRLGGEVQDGVEPATVEDLEGGVAQRPPHQPGPSGDRVTMPGRQVVEHDHVVAGLEQLSRDHTPDVAGATGDEQLHWILHLRVTQRIRVR
jgi:hypothetical protein